MAKKTTKKTASKKTAAKKAAAKKPVAKKAATKKAATKKTPSKKLQPNADGVVLLSGGNPQIPKGDGDAPVQQYIAAMPGWKQGIGRRIDDLVVQVVPEVKKAVKWNTPFYGLDEIGWFLTFHCFTKYIKVTFFAGSSLKPIPPGESKTPAVRYLDIYEDAGIDEKQLASWIKQAAQLPGWKT